jgi:hypothetical protein
MWGLLQLFRQEYTFEAPFLRFLFYGFVLLLFLLTLRAGSPLSSSDPARGWSARAESVAWVTCAAVFAIHNARPYLHALLAPCFIDIGSTTVRATQMVWLEHANPYKSPLSAFRFQADPRFWGYSYGPGMFLGYLPAVLGDGAPYKLTCLVQLGLIFAATALLAIRLSPANRTYTVASTSFALVLFTMAPFLFNDLAMGINDYFPTLLLLSCVAAVDTDRWSVAGALLGISFAAKFAPACYLLVLLVRRTTPRRFFLCFAAVAALSMAPFLALSPAQFVDNVFLKHFAKVPMGSGIFGFTPVSWWPLYRDVQVLVVAAFVYRNWKSRFFLPALVQDFVVFTLLINSLHKELHSNHFTWVYVFVVAHLAASRYDAWAWIRSLLDIIRTRAQSARSS